nr:efflux RND transporter periplasmic adaptor subunit [uncultured Rhodoferax sp.]
MNLLHFKPLTLGLLSASVLTLAGLGLMATRTRAADVPPAPTVAKAALTVSTIQAKSSQLPVKLAANGSVAAWQEASVGAEVGGLRVAELQVGVGDQVKRGQVLLTFASDSVQADVALARASLNEAQANAADALANADRARAVQGTGAVSAQQINQYLTQEATAKARVASAQAQLDAQLLRLKQTQLLAPDSGIISARSVSVGTVVGAGSELFKLIRQGRLEWRGEVTSSEFSRIRPGMAVLVTSPGGVQARGKVRMLAPTVDAVTRNGLVYVDLVGVATAGQSLGAAFKPGMYARGEFELGSSGALTVPQTAVVVRDGFRYVYRVGADNKVNQLKVQTGRVVGDQIEIQRGVNPDDKLVSSGGSFLSEGDTVKVVDAADSKPKAALAPAAAAQAATK